MSGFPTLMEFTFDITNATYPQYENSSQVSIINSIILLARTLQTAPTDLVLDVSGGVINLAGDIIELGTTLRQKLIALIEKYPTMIFWGANWNLTVVPGSVGYAVGMQQMAAAMAKTMGRTYSVADCQSVKPLLQAILSTIMIIQVMAASNKTYNSVTESPWVMQAIAREVQTYIEPLIGVAAGMRPEPPLDSIPDNFLPEQPHPAGKNYAGKNLVGGAAKPNDLPDLTDNNHTGKHLVGKPTNPRVIPILRGTVYVLLGLAIIALQLYCAIVGKFHSGMDTPGSKTHYYALLHLVSGTLAANLLFHGTTLLS